MKFEDIEFGPNHFGGVVAQVELKDNMLLSIVAGSMAYSTPRKSFSDPKDFTSFEIAIFDKGGEFVTRDHISDLEDDVKGWVGREEILQIIEKLAK